MEHLPRTLLELKLIEVWLSSAQAATGVKQQISKQTGRPPKVESEEEDGEQCSTAWPVVACMYAETCVEGAPLLQAHTKWQGCT